ncbi:MAG: hypothetical protein WHZ52_09680 [Armatimonadota bacterium]
MLKWTVRSILLLVAVAAFSLPAAAQDTGDYAQLPDAYVRGFGSYPVPADNASTIAKPDTVFFHINVTDFRGLLYGGMNYRRVTPDGKLKSYMFSTRIEALEIKGNFATIRAQAVYNGKPACMFVEVLDDTPSGDWAHFQANGCMLTVIYEDTAGGLNSGDIKVWTKPAPRAVAMGAGAIALPGPVVDKQRLGVFQFKAETTPAGPAGSLHYTDSPYNAASFGNNIFVPRWEKFGAVANRAEMAGRGYWNGRPAMVVVKVEDNVDPRARYLVAPPPDFFEVQAKLLNADPRLGAPEYVAGGPVIRGDIIVKTERAVTD